MDSILDGMGNPDVTMYVLCKRHNSLPYGGGVANQPARLIEKWILIENTIDARKELDSKMREQR